MAKKIQACPYCSDAAIEPEAAAFTEARALSARKAARKAAGQKRPVRRSGLTRTYKKH